MRKSQLTSAKKLKLIDHFVAGTTARCAADLVNLNAKTTTYYYHHLRQAITHELGTDSEQHFEGEVEADKSYFGVTCKGSHGRGAAGKNPYLVY